MKLPGWAIIVARAILGFILIYAGFDKIADTAQFARDIHNYSFPTMGLENLMAMVLPWLELLVGICLILGIMVDASAWLTLLMMTVFVVAISQAVLRGIDIECGCGLKEGEMVGIPKLLEDLVYILLSVLIIRRKDKSRELYPKSV